MHVKTSQSLEKLARLPADFPFLRYGVVLAVLCAAPGILMLFGADFSTDIAIDAHSLSQSQADRVINHSHQALRGSFTHTLLEWSAVCASMFIGIFSLFMYRQIKDSSLPVIGLALMCAGAMDCFHTLAADRLLVAATNPRDFIPLTWALCRIFTGVVHLLGVALFVYPVFEPLQQKGKKIIFLAGGTFATLALVSIYICATSNDLPQTMFPDSIIKRPYDVLPLLPFALCGLFVYPRYWKKHPNAFAYSLYLSLVPMVAVELYMAFGSENLHDSAFNVAHALKVLEYAVPLAGIVMVQTQITDRIREESTLLERARTYAEAASRSKSNFLANMSHEIRTPMTAILGYTEVLASPSLPEQKRTEYIRTIRHNGEHLMQIINDILDVSKIEAGQLTLSKASTNPVQITEGVLMLLSVKAQEKGLNLGVDYQENLPHIIQSDPTRLRQILVNLVGNAIKFTEMGNVMVKVRADTEHPHFSQDHYMIRFDVIDSGIGIPEAKLSELFQPFVQGNDEITRKYGGTGLGLNISQKLATLLGGEIKAQSIVDLGSVFSLTIDGGSATGRATIPTHTPAPPPTPHTEMAAPSPPPAHPAPPQKTQKSTTRGKILVAEDGVDNQKLISFFLKKSGAQVDVVENGKLALEEALKHKNTDDPYDLIFMDMQMPVMDGRTAVRKLREEGYEGPIIALTAHAMSEEKEQCLKAGCTDFMTKPFQGPDLVKVASHYIQAANTET